MVSLVLKLKLCICSFSVLLNKVFCQCSPIFFVISAASSLGSESCILAKEEFRKLTKFEKHLFSFSLPTFFAGSLQIDPDHSNMPRTTTEDSPKTTSQSIPIPRVPEHSAVNSPSLTDTTTPSPVEHKSPCSPLGCSLPCPATVLSLNSPHSESDPELDSAEHHRCHYRTQEMLEAAHLQPWEARWKCREAEGGGLELDSKSQEDIADGFRMAETK